MNRSISYIRHTVAPRCMGSCTIIYLEEKASLALVGISHGAFNHKFLDKVNIYPSFIKHIYAE